MSTWLYLECRDHVPPLLSEGESGQHLSDLAQIRADIADPDALLAQFEDEDEGGMDWDAFNELDHYRRNTIRFLQHHHACRIGIRDEYGHEHPATEANEPPFDCTHQRTRRFRHWPGGIDDVHTKCLDCGLPIKADA